MNKSEEGVSLPAKECSNKLFDLMFNNFKANPFYLWRVLDKKLTEVEFKNLVDRVDDEVLAIFCSKQVEEGLYKGISGVWLACFYGWRGDNFWIDKIFQLPYDQFRRLNFNSMAQDDSYEHYGISAFWLICKAALAKNSLGRQFLKRICDLPAGELNRLNFNACNVNQRLENRENILWFACQLALKGLPQLLIKMFGMADEKFNSLDLEPAEDCVEMRPVLNYIQSFQEKMKKNLSVGDVKELLGLIGDIQCQNAKKIQHACFLQLLRHLNDDLDLAELVVNKLTTPANEVSLVCTRLASRCFCKERKNYFMRKHDLREALRYEIISCLNTPANKREYNLIKKICPVYANTNQDNFSKVVGGVSIVQYDPVVAAVVELLTEYGAEQVVDAHGAVINILDDAIHVRLNKKNQELEKRVSELERQLQEANDERLDKKVGQTSPRMFGGKK